MKYFLSPLLVLTRIAIAAQIYKTLLNEIKTLAPNVTSRFWPPLIYKEILPEDVIMLVTLGFSNGLLGARYLSKKPLYDEVGLRY